MPADRAPSGPQTPLWRKLRERAYRRHFVSASIKRGVPFQLRAMLKARGWSQGELAQRAELTQGAVSRALNPDYGNLSINTLVRLAAGFDVACVVTFVPFSDIARRVDELSEDQAGAVPAFTDEDCTANAD